MKISWYDQDLQKHCSINVANEEEYEKLTHYEEEADKDRDVLDLINDKERNYRSFESFKKRVKENNILVTYE